MPPDSDARAETNIAVVGLTAAVVLGTVLLGLGMTPGLANETTEDSAYAQQGPALVRFAHAAPDGLQVNVSIGDQTLASNVSFGNVTEYFRVVEGEHTVTVTRFSTDAEGEVVLQSTISVTANTRYTVAVAGEWTASGDEGLRAQLLTDNATQPAANRSKIRVAHLSPDAPRIDVTVAGSNALLTNGLSYRNSSIYVTLPAGNYTLEIREGARNESGPIITTVNVSLEGGTAYEAYAMGYANPEQAIRNTSFDLVVAAPNVADPSPETMITPEPDEPEGTETPTEAENETAG